MEKRPYIAIHDYGQGAVVVRVLARSVGEVSSVLRRPNWVVYDEGDSRRPRWSDEDRLLVSDIDDKAPWLLEQIEVQRQEELGKRLFFFRARHGDTEKHRGVWARSESEVLARYPLLESMIGIGIPAEDLRAIRSSDFDEPDDFLRRHR